MVDCFFGGDDTTPKAQFDILTCRFGNFSPFFCHTGGF